MKQFMGIYGLPRLFCVVLGVRDNIIDKDGCTHAYRKSAVPDLNPRKSQAAVVANHPRGFCLEGIVMSAGFRARWGRWLGILGIIVGVLFVISSAKPQAKSDGKGASAVDFNRQILPLLSENCFACHGPDAGQRKAKLRLDIKEGAFAELRSGGRAVVPGKSSESKIIEKITAADPKNPIPPPQTRNQFKPKQISFLNTR